MPFTISHAAAVLPLRKLTRHGLPLAGLMIGSMSPDFSYFLPGDLSLIPTHTLSGLFWFCLPAGLAVWLMYVFLLEAPTRALLPEEWRTRIEPSDKQLTLKSIALTSVAVLIGAVTHVVWDSFTHRWSPVVEALPVLQTLVFRVGTENVYLYRFLQHASSLLGMAALLIWAWRIRRKEPLASARQNALRATTTATRIAAVSLMLVASISLGIANYLANVDTFFERRLFHLAIGGMTGWLLAWCAVAIALHWNRRVRPSTA